VLTARHAWACISITDAFRIDVRWPSARRCFAPSSGIRSRRLLEEDLENRVLEFDTAASNAAASLAVERQRSGRPIDLRDTQIAGIALARRGTIATRKTRHFADLKVPVVDPWTA